MIPIKIFQEIEFQHPIKWYYLHLRRPPPSRILLLQVTLYIGKRGSWLGRLYYHSHMLIQSLTTFLSYNSCSAFFLTDLSIKEFPAGHHQSSGTILASPSERHPEAALHPSREDWETSGHRCEFQEWGFCYNNRYRCNIKRSLEITPKGL